MQNATHCSKMQHCQSGIVISDLENKPKNIPEFGTEGALYIGIRKRELDMRKSVSVQNFTKSLPPIFTHDHMVYMNNGKVYRVYRQSSDYGVHEYMRSQGFDPKNIARIDLVPAK
jgi:hypothetical protein